MTLDFDTQLSCEKYLDVSLHLQQLSNYVVAFVSSTRGVEKLVVGLSFKKRNTVSI